ACSPGGSVPSPLPRSHRHIISDQMLQILYDLEGRPQVFNLTGEEAWIGRANDNDVVLNDFSVSRRHAVVRRENDAWVLYDNQSTNGVRVNDRLGPRAAIVSGDEAAIGTFVLRFREEAEARESKRGLDSTSTCIRPISEFNLDFGLDKSAEAPAESTDHRKRAVLDVAYKNKVFEI